MLMKNKIKTILAIVLCISLLVAGLLLKENRKKTVLFLGDNGYIEPYLQDINYNCSFTYQNMKSENLLYLINNNAKNGNKTIVESIRDSSFVFISIGINDILGKIVFNKHENIISYDLDSIELALSIYEQNMYNIIDDVLNINPSIKIYFIKYDNAFKNLSNSEKLMSYLNKSMDSLAVLFSLNCIEININEDNIYSDDYYFRLNKYGQEMYSKIVVKKVVAIISDL